MDVSIDLGRPGADRGALDKSENSTIQNAGIGEVSILPFNRLPDTKPLKLLVGG